MADRQSGGTRHRYRRRSGGPGLEVNGALAAKLPDNKAFVVTSKSAPVDATPGCPNDRTRLLGATTRCLALTWVTTTTPARAPAERHDEGHRSRRAQTRPDID